MLTDKCPLSMINNLKISFGEILCNRLCPHFIWIRPLMVRPLGIFEIGIIQSTKWDCALPL